MYEHHLQDQVDLLAEAGLVSSDKKSEALNVLKGYWEDLIAVSWSTVDIIDRAKTQGIELSQEDARSILYGILNRHNCEYGITWDTIDANLPQRRIDHEVQSD